ncbi:hypothetical protein HUA78_05510 [Myxococcus sp. CA033]|uniref:hypothetical protein n=1 Tax=Myxococcus sp. CA033 TaxID=2741516 RepID=UPI00157A38A9|nr:hypothetical protein [Myxococcus sp. CA033]NTX33886.1 hypothetical protein [Myxococcus sp. CA033]
MVRFQVKRQVNIDASRGARLREALDILERIVNSKSFRLRVLEHSAYTWNEGLTNEQILNRLIWGQPTPPLGALAVPRLVFFDYELVQRPIWKKLSSVRGWRIPETNDIYTYVDAFDSMSPSELASHLGHEVVGHLAGEFDHPSRKGPERDASVPYVIDDFIEELAEKLPLDEAA